jgi:hypothetical protein
MVRRKATPPKHPTESGRRRWALGWRDLAVKYERAAAKPAGKSNAQRFRIARQFGSSF